MRALSFLKEIWEMLRANSNIDTATVQPFYSLLHFPENCRYGCLMPPHLERGWLSLKLALRAAKAPYNTALTAWLCQHNTSCLQFNLAAGCRRQITTAQSMLGDKSTEKMCWGSRGACHFGDVASVCVTAKNGAPSNMSPHRKEKGWCRENGGEGSM